MNDQEKEQNEEAVWQQHLAVIKEEALKIDPETAGRWIHVSQWTATRPTPPASQGDVAFELEQRK